MISRMIRPSAEQRATESTVGWWNRIRTMTARERGGVGLAVAAPIEAVPASGHPRGGRDRTRAAALRKGGLPSECGWGDRRKGSTTRRRCWCRPRSSHTGRADVSVVRRVRCRSCVVISSARVNQRRAIDRSVCLADAAGVSRGPGRSAAQGIVKLTKITSFAPKILGPKALFK